MIPELAAWQWSLAFLAGAAVLVRAGVALAAASDELAERTGLGRVFVGTLFLAAATSLPEMLTDISAAVADAPDLAVGDLFGSSMANMAILAVIDLCYRGRVWPSVEVGHARVAAVAIGLTAVAVLGILTPPGWSLGWVGLDTVGVAGAYVAAVAWFRRSARAEGPAPVGPESPVPPDGLLVATGWSEPPGGAPVGLASTVRRFAVGALGVLVAAPVVAVAARELAHEAGIAETTVGAGLLAATTSLPELTASLAAVRIGAHDLAVGNLFGSNAANMSVLLLADAAYTKGPILAAVSPSQVVVGTSAILLMALAMAAIVGGTETRLRRVEPDAVILLVAYLGALAAVGVTA
jgi:cation:H+ antiporter